jgi:hypothetical protein
MGEQVISELPKVRVWDVRYSVPPSGDRKWRSNGYAHVVCKTAQRALEMVLEKLPDATIFAVHGRTSEADLLLIDAQ